MAFVKKDWANRISEYPNRRMLSIVEMASALETGTEIIVDVTRNEGEVSAEGDAFDETNMNDLEERISAGFDECLKFVSDGKTLVANAITAKKVPTAADATFEEMANNIGKITLGSGNATKSQVLNGRTFTNDDGVEYTGTMSDYSDNVQTVTPSASQTGTAEFDIPDGYHTKIKVNAANVYNAGKTAGASGKVTPSFGLLGTATDASANAKTLTIGASTRAVVMVMCYGDDSARGITSVTSSAGTLSKMSSYNNGKTGTNYTVTELYLLSNATSGATITVNGAWNKVIEAYRITA